MRVIGRDGVTNRRVAEELCRRLAGIPGIADAHLQQELDAPAFMVDIDRSRALQLGLNAQVIANDLNTSLSLHKSNIEQQHRPILDQLPADWIYDRDRCCRRCEAWLDAQRLRRIRFDDCG